MVPDDDRPLGSSGVFKAIVISARRLKRALSESEDSLSVDADEVGQQIARAFVTGRFADVHALGTTMFRERNRQPRFDESWREATLKRGPFTGFEVSNAGNIDLHYIPGLEDVPQEAFVAFVEIVFSSPQIPLDQEGAFAVGAVLLDEGGQIRIGAIHAR